MLLSCRPVTTSHNLIVLSQLTDSSVLPSGEKITDQIFPQLCPSSVFSCCPESISHSLIVLSVRPALPEASILPLGEKARDATESVVPVRVFNSRPDVISHNLMVRS